MQGVSIIERAFQLAPQCQSIEELQKALSDEGYSQVIEHLKGPLIRSQIAQLLNSGLEENNT